MTTGVVTGDAQKEASLSEASLKDSLPSPQGDGSDSSITADAATKGNDGPEELTLISEPVTQDAPQPTFEDFYAVYPRRVGPQKARLAWDKAVRAGADPVAILEGARRVAEQPDLPDRKDTERWSKIPHPTSWLNAGRWEDEEPLYFGYTNNSGRGPAYDDQAVWGTEDERRAEAQARTRAMAGKTQEQIDADLDELFQDNRPRPGQTMNYAIGGQRASGDYR